MDFGKEGALEKTYFLELKLKKKCCLVCPEQKAVLQMCSENFQKIGKKFP